MKKYNTRPIDFTGCHPVIAEALVKRIMPPERAIPVLIAEGWRFDNRGALRGETYCVVPQMFEKMGKPLDDPSAISWSWPSCIIEEVEDDE